MPAAVDVLFAFLVLAVASTFEYVYFWPGFRAELAQARPDARRRAYQRMLILQWFLAATAVAIWISHDRSWAAMNLALPHGWRLAIAFGVVLAVAALLVLQFWQVVRLPVARRIATRPKLDAVAFLLPHTHEETMWFVLLSVTAGFCEELLYRGYLVWFFAPWIGMLGAMVAMVLAFGVSHMYQGPRGAIKATIAGAVMAAIVLATDSLIPAMIVHALIDIEGATVGYWLLRDEEFPEAPSAENAPVARLISSSPALIV